MLQHSVLSTPASLTLHSNPDVFWDVIIIVESQLPNVLIFLDSDSFIWEIGGIFLALILISEANSICFRV